MRKICNKGLTLLELLVAVVLIGVLFVVLLSGFSVMIKSLGISEQYTQAGFLLKTLVEKVEHDKNLSEGKKQGDFGDQFQGYAWEIDVTKDNDKEEFYKVLFKVIFTFGGTERSIEASSVVLPYLNKKN